MANLKRNLLAAVAAGAIVACGGSSGPSADSLVGTWIASPAHASTFVEFVDKSNPSAKVELIALGGTVTLTLKQDKTFTLTVSIPGQSPEADQGTWSSSSDVLTLTYSPTSNMQFDLGLSGNTLSLGGADAPFDVNDDGVEESTKLSVKMVRQ